MVKFRSAVSAFKALNGVICVYKPACVPVQQVKHAIITNLCKELNELPYEQEKRVEIVGPTNQPMIVRLAPNYADDPLVSGPRFIKEDFRCSTALHLGLFSSGVLLIGINGGTRLTYNMNLARLTRAYKIHGVLGRATDTYFWNGKLVEKSTYNHVTREKIDSVVAHMQVAHQKTMFDLAGVHMDSQAMYELASQGPIRPTNSKLPVIYGLRCVHFQPPHFTLEVQAINEYDKYLWTLVHDLGYQLKTSAHCVGVQCIRHGKFDVQLSLLRKHWQLAHIVNNMDKCGQIIEENEALIRPESARLKV